MLNRASNRWVLAALLSVCGTASGWAQDPPAEPVVRLGSLRFRGAGDVKALAFSPDGKSFASAGTDHVIRFWDWQTGQEVRRFVGHDEMVMCLAFSPDGRTLASGGYDQTVRLWELATGTERHRLKTSYGWVSSIAFSPDGRTLASGSRSRAIHFWEVATGNQVREILEPSLGALALAFSRDGETLAAATRSQGLTLWQVASGKLLKKLEGHRGNVYAVALSPDGQTLASAGTDRTIRLWSLPKGEELRRLDGHADTINALLFTSDSQALISGAGDGTIRWWNPTTGKERHVYHTLNDEIGSLALAPDGQTLVSAGRQTQSIRVWDTTTGKQRGDASGHGSAILAMAYSADGSTLATAGRDRTLRLWDTATGKERGALPAYRALPQALAFSPDGKLIATAEQAHTARLWDIAGGKEIASFQGNGASVIGLGFSAGNEPRAWVSENLGAKGNAPVHFTTMGGTAQVLRFIDWNARKEVGIFKPDPGQPADQPAARGRLGGHFAPITAVAVSSPKRDLVATGGADKTINLWRAHNGKLLARLEGHGGAVTSLAFSADDRLLVSVGDDRSVRVWEVATQQTLHKIDLGGEARAAALAPNSRFVAWAKGADHLVHLVDLASGGADRTLSGHTGTVEALAFAPDGKHLASGSADTTGLIWEVKAGAVPAGRRFETAELEKVWAELANPEDAGKAFALMARLMAVPEQAVAFFKARLTEGKQFKAIPQLIAELDDEKYAVRQRAAADLELVGERARGEMIAALKNKPSLEIWQRLETLLMTLDQRQGRPSPDELRQLRSVTVLEWLNTPAARQFLEELGKGSPNGWLTQEASAALARLNK